MSEHIALTESHAFVQNALEHGFDFRVPGQDREYFDLHSGGQSPWLMDTYPIFSHSSALKHLGKLAWETLKAEGIDFEWIGGKWLGASVLTFTTLLSAGEDEPAINPVHQDGTKAWFCITKDNDISPTPLVKDRIVIVENTTTTGTEMFNAVDALAKIGCTNITGAMAVFDRSDGKVAERFAESDIPYIALFTLENDFPSVNGFVSNLVKNYPGIYSA